MWKFFVHFFNTSLIFTQKYDINRLVIGESQNSIQGGNSMKKFISILLVAVMMLSFTVTGFAARETVKLNTTYTATVKNEELKYSFYAPEDGVYSFEARLLSDSGSEYVTVSLETADSFLGMGILSNIDDEYSEPTPEDGTIFVARKNQEVSLTVSNFNEDYPEAKISFTFKRNDSLTEIKMGQSYTTNGADEYYVLRPTKDAIFDISSNSSGYITVEGTDSTYHWFDYSLDQLDLPINAKAGELYLVYVSNFYYDSDYEQEAKPITFTVSDGSTIKPEVINIDEITVVKGNYDYFYVSVSPNGSFYNYDELVFEFADGSIAEVLEYDKEFGTVTIKGNKLGKTTLKVTEPISGVTAETSVRVVSAFRMFFIDLFASISAFFALIFGR